jgi:hypothetical protein
MKYTAVIIALLAALSPLAVLADTFRCGNSLINQGDRTFEVRKKCGEPAHRDFIGYMQGDYGRRESTREEWVYGPRNGGTYVLTFEANRLVSIEFARD